MQLVRMQPWRLLYWSRWQTRAVRMTEQFRLFPDTDTFRMLIAKVAGRCLKFKQQQRLLRL